jgi:hypothetical protein
LVKDVVADLGASNLQPAHHGCRWVVVKHLLERLIVDNELSTPVSNLIAVDAAHEALVNIPDRVVNSDLEPMERGARWGIAPAPSPQWCVSLTPPKAPELTKPSDHGRRYRFHGLDVDVFDRDLGGRQAQR